MSQVETVRGPVEASELGGTLMHEHIFILNPELEQNYPSPEWNEEAALKDAHDGLQALHAKGISTVVDLTVMGILLRQSAIHFERRCGGPVGALRRQDAEQQQFGVGQTMPQLTHDSVDA